MRERKNNSQKSRIDSRERLYLLLSAGAILALMAVVATTAFLFSRRNKAAEVAAPGFVLHDQQGRLTSLAQFRGKVVLLTFIDPECTQICPLTTKSMVDAVNMLGPAAASQVQLLGININPLKTGVADVAAYTRSHGLQGRWRFLTGSPDQLKKIWHQYNIYEAVVNGDIEHEAAEFLIDANGKERAIYSTPMSYQSVGDQARTFAEGIAPLLPGHPAVSASSHSSPQQQEAFKPTDTVTLTALGPARKPVVLGGAHPHLMVFFAGWLGQDADLSKNLAVLDSYAALARRQGWPSPVAVDETAAEPSQAEAREMLTPLAARLQTPIVEDASGRLADGYQVEDMPWAVLISASGKILWSHDGWLSADNLDKDIRAALASS